MSEQNNKYEKQNLEKNTIELILCWLSTTGHESYFKCDLYFQWNFVGENWFFLCEQLSAGDGFLVTYGSSCSLSPLNSWTISGMNLWISYACPIAFVSLWIYQSWFSGRHCCLFMFQTQWSIVLLIPLFLHCIKPEVERVWWRLPIEGEIFQSVSFITLFSCVPVKYFSLSLSAHCSVVFLFISFHLLKRKPSLLMAEWDMDLRL